MNNIDHTSHDIYKYSLPTVISQKYRKFKIFITVLPYKESKVIQYVVVIDNHCTALCFLSNQEKQNRASLPVAVVINSAINNLSLMFSDPALFVKLS